MRINVHFLPALTTAERLAGKIVVVIDVLRATTTIVFALAAGATEVIPCLEVEEAREAARRRAGRAALGGERGGLAIEGFDLGNSPAEYTPESVRGKSVFFTTTNGTRAMTVCRQARRVLLAGFVNLSAVCQELKREADEVLKLDIICAGTDGEITREDVLLAGAITDELIRGRMADLAVNDQANIARDAWLACQQSGVPLEVCLLASRGGRNLCHIGHASDIRLATQIDRHTVVPELLLEEWRIVNAKR